MGNASLVLDVILAFKSNIGSVSMRTSFCIVQALCGLMALRKW